MSLRNSSDTSDSVNEDGKERRRFNRTAQRGEVDRVLERMNSQSVLITGSTGLKTKGASARRADRLNLTDHGDFNARSRMITQSAHVDGGVSRGTRRGSLLERLDSENSFGSSGSFGNDDEEPEKPASVRPRPNLRSGALNAANKVLGRMESKRTLTDLIEDNRSKIVPSRTRSSSSTDEFFPATTRSSTSKDGSSRQRTLSNMSSSEENDEESDGKADTAARSKTGSRTR